MKLSSNFREILKITFGSKKIAAHFLFATIACYKRSIFIYPLPLSEIELNNEKAIEIWCFVLQDNLIKMLSLHYHSSSPSSTLDF